MHRSHKKCHACGCTLPISAFHLNRTKLDGHADECKTCSASYQRARRQRISAQNMALRAATIERLAAAA